MNKAARRSVVVRRRNGTETKVYTGSYEFSTFVKAIPKKPAKAKLNKAERAAIRHDAPMSIYAAQGLQKNPLTKKEQRDWSEGLRILRNRGVVGSSRFTFNEMKTASWAAGFQDQLNW